MAAVRSQAVPRRAAQRPGVYRMYGAERELLYVGKARSLKDRVGSYFAAEQHRPEGAGAGAADHRHRGDGHELRDRGAAARIQPHQGAQAALQHRAARRQELPLHPAVRRPRVSRGSRSIAARAALPGRYFGPFPNAGAVRDTLNQLQKLFRIRNCRDTFFANRSRPCLQHQIGRCSAPCVGLITREAYAQDMQSAVKVLEGRSERGQRGAAGAHGGGGRTGSSSSARRRFATSSPRCSACSRSSSSPPRASATWTCSRSSARRASSR